MHSHHPPTPSSEEEGENCDAPVKAPSSSEEGVGGGASPRSVMLKRAASMRREPTEPERRMWMTLRDRRFAGYKFRRQAIIEGRIVDFFCPSKGLVIEIDGDTHDRELDLRRDRALERSTGFRTVRFTNLEVMSNMEGVQIVLLQALQSGADRWRGGRGTTPQPPPLKRRGS